MKVLVAESQKILRIGLRSILAADARVSEVYEATNEREMHHSISIYQPDLIVVNEDLLRDFTALCTKRFVIITNELKLAQLKEAYEAGALGYLSVNVSSKMLCSLLCFLHQSFLIEPALVPTVMDHLLSCTTLPLLDEALLTSREREIVCLLRTGVDRASIASQLCISEATLKTHLRNIARKHNTSSPVLNPRRNTMGMWRSRASY